MDDHMLLVPVSRLLDTDLTASAKVIWMVLRFEPHATPADLESLTGLSRPTVLHGLAQAKAHKRSYGGPKVKLPRFLLIERSIGAQAKVLYGLLQATPNFRGMSGWFTYASLHSLTGLSPSTLKRALAGLVQAGWIMLSQENRLSPVHFKLGNPVLRRSLAEASAASRRLKRAEYGGEALMQEYLSLLISSDQFTDNARPGFLINPQTGERLELDRFYPPNVGFEFNGSQHYHETERFTQDEVDTQHIRDLIKAGLCLYRGIHLVIVHAEDLSVAGMIKKIGRCMPLRDLTGHEPLIDLLEEESLKYRAGVTAAFRERTPG